MIAIVLAALSVGLDNFAAAIGMGTARVDARRRVEVALVFGLFEGAVPVLGILAGHQLSGSIGSAARPLGAGLLVLTGCYALVSARHERSRGGSEHGPSERRAARSGGLVALLVTAAALSVDNLVVGFALGSYQVGIAAAAVIMAAMSALLSLLGLELGERIGRRIGEASEYVGGAVLVAVGAALGLGLE